LEENAYYSVYTAWNLGIPLGLERRLDPISRGISLASIKASLTPWCILSSTWLVLHHWIVRNTVVTATTSQACPELLPAFLSSVSWFIAEFIVLNQLPTFHLDSLVSSNISPGIQPLVVVVDVVVMKSWSNIGRSLLEENRLGVVLAPHALYLGHGVFYQLSSLDHLSVAADTTGKKNGLVWGSPASPAAKNSSTRP
ncbi:hypothetical protein Taro_042406, partial [Colocasia esculenta]|nr:hypothetical protein [Colocasia esculenta]